jgi:methionyl-tRNA formyltransferase
MSTELNNPILDLNNPRLVIITNGNFFARIILDRLVHERHDQIVGIIIVTGIKAGRSRWQSLLEIWKRSGGKHFLYKMNSYLIFAIVGAILPNKTFFAHQLAKLYKIPVRFTQQVNGQKAFEQIKSWQPDVLISVSCPQRIGHQILSVASRYSINIHSSLLPEYAGISPYFWVLAEGEKKTGTTVHLMEEKFDTGSIILQQQLDIMPEESVFSLFFRLSRLGADVLASSVSILTSNQPEFVTQDISKRTYYSWPTIEGAHSLYSRGHKFARLSDYIRAIRATD